MLRSMVTSEVSSGSHMQLSHARQKGDCAKSNRERSHHIESPLSLCLEGQVAGDQEEDHGPAAFSYLAPPQRADSPRARSGDSPTPSRAAHSTDHTTSRTRPRTPARLRFYQYHTSSTTRTGMQEQLSNPSQSPLVLRTTKCPPRCEPHGDTRRHGNILHHKRHHKRHHKKHHNSRIDRTSLDFVV